MKLKKFKANLFLFWNNLFRLPAVALAILCLFMLHAAYYISTECGRSIFTGTALLRNRNTKTRERRIEAFIEAVHEYGREFAGLVWLFICIKAAFKIWQNGH